MRTMSKRSMATMLMLGVLAISTGQPTFASTRSIGLRGAAPLVRNAPSVPTPPTHARGERISEGRQTRSFGAPGLDGTWYGAVQTLLFVILR